MTVFDTMFAGGLAQILALYGETITWEVVRTGATSTMEARVRDTDRGDGIEYEIWIDNDPTAGHGGLAAPAVGDKATFTDGDGTEAVVTGVETRAWHKVYAWRPKERY